MLSLKVIQNLSSKLRYSNRGRLDAALRRPSGSRPPRPSHPPRSVRFFSATHASRSAVLAVSGRVTTDPEDLRRHTSHRWLFDEEKQLAARYVPFDPEALERVASESVGSRCVRIDKVAEDDFNRTFLLSFENGKEAFARFPYPVLGPTDLIAASEAATTHFVGEIFRLPTPKLLAYSSRAHDDASVGAAYVLTEKPPGVPFSAVSKHLERTRRESFMKRLGTMIDLSSCVPFSHAGSLYFSKDIEDLLHTTTGILSDAASAYFSPLDSQRILQYAIGPCVNWELWRGARQHLSMDRGPWETVMASIEGMIQSQQTWLKAIPARRSQDPAYFDEEDASPAAHIAALDDLLACMPHMSPPYVEVTFASLGPHHQLGEYASIDPSDPYIERVLSDWQRVVILPYFLQGSATAESDDDGPLDQTQVDVLMAGELLKVIKTDSCRPYAAPGLFRRLLDRHMRAEGEQTVSSLSSDLPLRTWQYSVHMMKEKLVYIQRSWSYYVEDDAPCPLHYSDEECARIRHEAWRFTRRAATSWLLALMVGANPDGRVPTQNYARARMLCDRIAEGWISFPDEDNGPFPLQDGGRSTMNS